MATARPRSVNRELDAGSTDGKYRKVVADRGGDVEMTFVRDRLDLTDGWYGIHQAESFVRPDGKVCAPLFPVSTGHATPEYF